MNITINTELYRNTIKNKGLSYMDIAEIIKNEFDVDYTPAGICRLVRGNSLSYKGHYYVANALNLSIDRCYTWK